MECMHCKGKLVRSTAPLSVTRNGYHIFWDAIPAWVCTQCGEPLFEVREVALIQEALKGVDEENRRMQARRHEHETEKAERIAGHPMKPPDIKTEPTLDYQRLSLRHSKAYRLASFLNTITWTLFAPSALLVGSVLTIDPVHRHWLSGDQFNEMGEVFMVRNGVSFFTGLIACAFGSNASGLAIFLNFLALIFVPSLMYA